MRLQLLTFWACLSMAINVFAENTKTIDVTFSDYAAGTQYAENERHDLGDGLVIKTTLCYFTEQLRVYSSSTYNGYVISDPLPGAITSMTLNMGYKKDVLNVYGSTDQENWTLIKAIKTTSTSYKDYKLNFPEGTNYTSFKLDVKGENQIRIASMSVTFVDTGEPTNSISVPLFNPVSSTFSTDSLNVVIETTEGYDIYYTTNGSDPSYNGVDDFVGTKGSIATIYAVDAPVELKAIAVDPTTGKCSKVSSATYTYIDLSIANDGTKTRPYTVGEVKQMKKDYFKKWVRGTIYGTMVNSDISGVVTSDFKSQSNLVIGDEEVHIPVQLKNGSDIREEINLVDHPYLKGKNILIKGDLTGYCGSQGIKEPTEYKITHDVVINSYGYATLFLDMPVSLPIGTTSYYCTVEGNYVNLFPIGDIIPSNVGVVIEANPNTTCTLTYTTKENANTESITTNSQLVGFVEDTVIAVDGYAYYELNAKDNQLGFYIPQTATNTTDAAGGFTAIAHEAYLKVDAEQKAVKFLFHRGNDETVISTISHIYDDIVYDLQGRIVSSPVPGIYIRGGKIFVVK